MYSGDADGFKGNALGVKEISGIIGPLEEAILEFCLHNGYRFKVAFVVDWIIERGLAPETARHKLLKRVHDAVKRLVNRQLVRRLARGFYELVANIEELASRLKPARIQSLLLTRGVKETHGTRVPPRGGGGGGGGVVGVYLDNLRGYTSGGYVGGDRGAVRGLGDLVFFERVSYSELVVGLGTGLLEGLGQVVMYYSCKDVPGYGFACGDWLEWRPPRGFVKRHGVPEARRVFVNRVVPLAFGLAGRAGVVVGSSFGVLARFLFALARSLYVYVRSRGRGGGVDF